MPVDYEWDVETVEIESEDIVDHEFCKDYADAKATAATAPGPGHRHDIVLVRDDDNGRSWAYMEDGKLPSHFSDAYGNAVAKVPKRFTNEVAKVLH